MSIGLDFTCKICGGHTVSPKEICPGGCRNPPKPAPSPPTEAAVPGRLWIEYKEGTYHAWTAPIANDPAVPYIPEQELLKQVRQARAEEKTKMLREAIWIMEECTDWDGGLEELWKLLREAKAEQAREEGK